MKILLVNLVRQGGMVHYHSQLSSALVKHNINVVALISRAANQQYYSDLPEVITISTGTSARTGLLSFLNPLSWLVIWQTIRKNDIDLIHITSPYIWNIAFIWFVRKPIVYTVHDPEPHTGEKKWVAWIEKALRDKATLLVVHGQRAKQLLIGQGCPADSIHISKHGDYNFFQKQSAMHQSSATNHKSSTLNYKLLFFGRIEPYKGLDILLDAMPQIWQAHPDWQLIVAGQGDLPKHSVLSDNRIMLKNYFIADDQVADLFQSAEIVILPYRDASQSGVIPIASAFSKPVIATNVGSLGDVIDNGKTGLLVPPESAQDLAQAVIALIEDPAQRRTMGINALKKMTNELDWAKIAPKYDDIYSHALTYKSHHD